LKLAEQKTIKARTSQSPRPKKAEIYRELSDIINQDRTGWQPLSHRYFVVELEPGTRKIVQEYAPNCVRYVVREALVNELSQYISENLGGMGMYALTVKELRETVDYWMSETKAVPEPISIVEKSDPRMCFLRLPFNYGDPAEAETPTFDEFFSRADNSDAIKAFIGSCLVTGSNRQQYLWLYGEGGDGKGSFVKALEPLFGEFFISTVAPKNGGARFWTNSLVGKRLVLFPDNNNYRFVNDGIFKACTGDDRVPCELKGGANYTAKLECKFIFLSNEMPDIDGTRASLRRAIYSKITPPTGKLEDLSGEYADSMQSEVVDFAKKCVIHYMGSYDLHEVIKVDEDKLSELTSFNEEYFEFIFKQCFEEAKGASIQGSEMVRKLTLHKLNQFERRDFIAFMQRTKKISRKKTKTGAYYQGLRSRPDPEMSYDRVPKFSAEKTQLEVVSSVTSSVTSDDSEEGNSVEKTSTVQSKGIYRLP